jgi:hypothetical protein
MEVGAAEDEGGGGDGVQVGEGEQANERESGSRESGQARGAACMMRDACRSVFVLHDL